MRRFKNMVIGGIQNKLFNLVLVTVILLTGAFYAVSTYQTNELQRLAEESTERQQSSIQEITNNVMVSVVDQAMGETTNLEAYIANELFQGLGTRVTMLGDYAAKLFAEPDAYHRAAYAGPDAADHGKVVTQLILAEGVNAEDPGLADRIGLAANMSDLMVAIYSGSEQTNSCFIALPDGAFLVTDDRSGAKFDADGNAVPYDPRTRPWYQQAVEAGKLIFTDVEIDAFTGDIGIVGAMPVYADGELVAVVGSDLFLTSMQAAVESSDQNSSFDIVVNQHGHVVFSPKKEGTFRVVQGTEASDLRASESAELAALVSDAMQGQTGVRLISLPEGNFYMAGAPLSSIGWALIAVCDQTAINQPSVMLREANDRIQEDIAAEYRLSTGRSRTTATALLLLVAALMLAGGLLLAKKIVQPLNTMTERIASLQEGNLEFKMEDTFRTGDEIEELAQSFADISHKTVEYMGTIREVTAEKERIETELTLATQIQTAMLPHIYPPFPGRTEFDLIASMDPAKEVGGDFFDYFLIDDDHLCMVIADVSGKGVPAALFMMASRIILQSVAMLGTSSPAEILARTNQAICSNNEAEMFVTVWLGILTISTGKLTASNAGHEYPAIRRPDGTFELYRDRHGFVIGGMEDVRYGEYELQLEPGSALFVYTDGVTEATNANNELFGTDRMLEALNTEPNAAPLKLMEHVRKAVDGFVKDAPQFDDMTMLCMEYKGKQDKKA